MDIEHLNKKQIILLTLLVSFVTSIATGIVTVSLMAQVPPPVTQTINRVVERTLERVVEKKTDAAGKVTTKEKTVVVKETDLISQAVQAALPSLVSIYVVEHAPSTPTTKTSASASGDGVDSASSQQSAVSTALEDAATSTVDSSTKGTIEIRRFVARGVFTSDSAVLTDASRLPEGAQVEVVTSISRTPLVVSSIIRKGALATLVVPGKNGVPIRRGDVQVLQLGNTLVSLGGEERLQVATGVISDLDRNDSKQITGISIDSSTALPGAALVNLEGQLIAVYAKGTWVLQ